MVNASVTLDPSSTPANPKFNFVVPQGEKGDPGGFTAATNLTGATAQLNDLKTPGLYVAYNGADITLANNWPVAGQGGAVEVLQWGSPGYIMQKVTVRGETSGTLLGSLGEYTRTVTPTAFSKWSLTPTQDNVQPINLADTDNLNNIVQPGTYSRILTPIAGNNYPPLASSGGGSLVVTKAGNSALQEYVQPDWSSSGSTMISRRNQGSGGAWLSWVYYFSGKWDYTAGRVFYQRDRGNNQDQLIYGDTGLRQIVAPGAIANMPNLAVYSRRVNYEVSIIITEITGGGSASGATTLIAMPSGYRPVVGGSAPSINASVVFDPSVTQLVNSSLYISNISPWNLTLKATAGQRHYATLQYITLDPWPTVLPGTASGTIPNL